MSTEVPKITALAPWFGSNRMLASEVGKQLRGCKWVGVPFAGGMSELLHIKASTIVVGDLHNHVINLARVIQDPQLGPKLYRRLRRAPFHPWTLEVAQRACATYSDSRNWDSEAMLNFAEMYFVCCWMGRSAKAGTDGEFNGGLPVRWSASGGDSNTRFRSAADSLMEWRRVMIRCNFVVQDVFAFLGNAKDQADCGLYLDPPFPGPGDAYRHKFNESKQVTLAARLREFSRTRVVCRFYDVPLIRELYQTDRWNWLHLEGRKQSNDAAPEVLIVNGELTA